MSEYKAHLLVYLVLSAAIIYFLDGYMQHPASIIIETASVAVGAVYSILPDIDTPSSIMRRIIEKLGLVSIIASIGGYFFLNRDLFLYIAVALAFFLLLLWYLKHRGFFHSIAAGLLLSAPLLLLNPWICAFAFFGYYVHLTVDGKMLHLI